MTVSLPDIRNSIIVVRRFIRQFDVGEDSRFKEESVGIKSEPQARSVV
jgi:hypothetical protein